MEIHSARTKNIVEEVPEKLVQTYPHDVSLYGEIPAEEINLHEFEKYVTERVLLLMCLKTANDKGFPIFSDSWKKCVQDALAEENLYDFQRLIFSPDFKKTPDDIRRRRKDHFSHWLVCIGYCVDNEKRSWLLNLEMLLFRLRFMNLSEKAIREFLKINQMEFELVGTGEKNLMKRELINSSAKLTSSQFESIDYYKVNWRDAPELLSEMMCTRKGLIYVPHTEIFPLVESIFRRNLNKRLAVFYKNLSKLQDSRIDSVMKDLRTAPCYDGNQHGREVTLASLDEISKHSFPLCARNLYIILKQVHHLKYSGRQFFQLFLKNIGLSVEGCLELFRTAFTKKIDEDSFQKNYVYQIRHNYGLEGSKINYNPPSCVTIMKTTIGEGDHHGCPFHSWQLDQLKRVLEECNLGSIGMIQVMDAVKNKHPQIACSRFFELTHNGTKAGINHPNQYFDESRNYFQPVDKTVKKENIKQEIKKEDIKQEIKKEKAVVVKTETKTVKKEEAVKKEPDSEIVDDLMQGINMDEFDSDMQF